MVDVVTFIFDMLGGLYQVFIGGPASKLDVLYILVPVYINWLVNDYYQERKGTSLGNAAANGFVAVWVGIDWFRTMIPRMGYYTMFSFSWMFLAFKFLVAIAVLIYGITVMRYAIEGNPIAKKIGKIREISYICLVFTPFVYDLIKVKAPTFMEFLPTFIGVILFFPVFYFIVDYIMVEILPAPATEFEEA